MLTDKVWYFCAFQNMWKQTKQTNLKILYNIKQPLQENL